MFDRPRTLEQMQNRHTRYEVVLMSSSHGEVTVTFTARHSRRALIDITYLFRAEILAHVSECDAASDVALGPNKVIFGGSYLTFSGRTERDVRNLLERKGSIR